MSHACLNVLIVGPFPPDVGGMASVCDQLVRADWRGECRVGSLAISRASGEREAVSSKLLRHARHLLKLRRIIRRDKIDIVHVHTCSGVSFYRSVVDMHVARWSGAKAILHIHGAKFEEFITRSHRLFRWFIRRALTKADGVIALSDGWKRCLHDAAPQARIDVVENTVPLQDTGEPRTGDRSTCRFLFLARTDHWKGVVDLLQAAAQVRDRGVKYDLVIAGPPGDAQADMERLIAEHDLGNRVRCIGPVFGQDKAALLASSDALVIPSHNEGLPMVMLEAMSAGLPVIATRVGAIPEVIGDHREGLLVPARHPAAFAGAMAVLADQPDLRLRLGQAGRRLIRRRFSTDTMIRAITRIYRRIPAGVAFAKTAPTGRVNNITKGRFA